MTIPPRCLVMLSSEPSRSCLNGREFKQLSPTIRRCMTTAHKFMALFMNSDQGSIIRKSSRKWSLKLQISLKEFLRAFNLTEMQRRFPPISRLEPLCHHLRIEETSVIRKVILENQQEPKALRVMTVWIWEELARGMGSMLTWLLMRLTGLTNTLIKTIKRPTLRQLQLSPCNNQAACSHLVKNLVKKQPQPKKRCVILHHFRTIFRILFDIQLLLAVSFSNF